MELLAIAVGVALCLALAYSWRRRVGASTSPSSLTIVEVQPERGFLAAPKQTRLFEFESVIVADERGTTEVDVIVVGNSGVFVVEIKDFNSWIFGNENDERWTAVYPDKSKHQFQNPLRQNFRHIKALESRLALPFGAFHSIVAFTGNCDLKTQLPPNVVKGQYRRVIENADGIRLTDSEVTRVCRALEELETSSTRDALDTHVADLKARYSSATNCPKCGASLVERRSRAAAADSPSFLGCKAFPRCRYTRQLDAT